MCRHFGVDDPSSMNVSQGREVLPTNVKPVHYDLTLEPDFDKFTYNGTVTIDLEVADDTTSITLNTNELKIHSTKVTTGQQVVSDSPTVTADDEAQTTKVSFDQTIPRGSKAQLTMTFSGILNDNMAGFYRSSFKAEDGSTTYMATTQELKVFYNFLYISLGLAGFLLVMITIQKRVNFTQSEYGVSAGIVIFLLFLPLLVVSIEEHKIWQSKRLALVDPSPVKIVTEGEKVKPNEATDGKTAVSSDTKWCENVFSPPERGEDYTILQALFSIDMLILFITCICGVGGTLTAIDNLGQIGSSLRYPKKSISTFVSLVSIWNYLGRVFSGFVSEHFLVKYKFPRPLMLTLTLLVSCVGHLLIAFDVPNGLYAASVIIGFCFGAQWPLLFAIISELFGLKYYATLYNFGSVASPLGLYLLNVKMTGYLYDKEAKKQLAALGLQRKEGQELKCIGVDCFRLSFIVIAAATFFGAIVSLILVARTRKFYSSDIYKRFRDAATVSESEMAAVENTSKAEKDGKQMVPTQK